MQTTSSTKSNYVCITHICKNTSIDNLVNYGNIVVYMRLYICMDVCDKTSNYNILDVFNKMCRIMKINYLVIVFITCTVVHSCSNQ